MDRLRLFMVSGWGSGLLPWAPGTWGSAAAVGVWVLLVALVGADNLGVRKTWDVVSLLTAGLALLAVVTCVQLGPWAIRRAGRGDPGWVVVDEWAGQWIALLAWPIADGVLLTQPTDLAIFAAAQFMMFRLFDVLKPWPCRRLEKLPAGWGIVADDLMAGVYANVAGQLLLILGANMGAGGAG